MIEKATEQELIRSYIDGNHSSLQVLIQRHQNRLYSYIFLLVKDKMLADDVFQDTYVKVINTLKQGNYKDEGKFVQWVMRIAHNLAVDHFRKGKRYPTIIMEDGSPLLNTIQFSEDSYENVQIQKDTHDRLKKLIQELPMAQKEVLIMRHYMKMSFKEIAETTGVSINTTLGRMRYALINLRKKMTLTKSAYDKNFYPD